MNLRIEITISSHELDMINLVISILKTKVFKIMLIPGGFTLTSWDGTWPDDLHAQIRSEDENLEVDMVDGIKSPSFKRVAITGFPRLFD
jgi:hypothetical protein